MVMDDAGVLFPVSYEQSRERFRQMLPSIQEQWPEAQLQRHMLGQGENLTIDWVEADATAEPRRLLLFATGIHGVEAYIGSSILHLLLREYVDRLNPQNTGLYLVHALNPWGMKHRRRTNVENVDLNRNFWWGEESHGAVNPEYARLNSLLNPSASIGGLARSRLAFYARLLWLALRSRGGMDQLRQTALLGQSSYPCGLYYTGRTIQPETRMMMDLLDRCAQRYQRLVVLDVHSGYGPRGRMTLVHSPLEPRTSLRLARTLSYEPVVKAESGAFYDISGDMIDYVYKMRRDAYPDLELYAASFEFGTWGDSFPAKLRALHTMILENQAHWYDASDPMLPERIEERFVDLYYPSSERWRARALKDARRALNGVLTSQGYFAE
jgi:hypothetical protein